MNIRYIKKTNEMTRLVSLFDKMYIIVDLLLVMDTFISIEINIIIVGKNIIS